MAVLKSTKDCAQKSKDIRALHQKMLAVIGLPQSIVDLLTTVDWAQEQLLEEALKDRQAMAQQLDKSLSEMAGLKKSMLDKVPPIDLSRVDVAPAPVDESLQQQIDLIDGPQIGSPGAGD